MISETLSRQIQDHALESYPLESVGMVVDGKVTGRYIEGDYIRLENVHPQPTHGFRVSGQDMLRMEGRITAIVHSHPDGGNAPSASDMMSQQMMNLPYIIVATDGTNCLEPFEFGDCLEPLPLEGRPFRHAVTDCYELMRDYWMVNFGYRLQNIPRDWEWWRDGLDLYRDYFEPAGFRALRDGEQPQKHDCFFMSIGSKVPNHGGIYLGNGEILHHLGSTRHGPYSSSHLSVREFGGRYETLSPMFVRFKEPLP